MTDGDSSSLHGEATATKRMIEAVSSGLLIRSPRQLCDDPPVFNAGMTNDQIYPHH
jgi:hypothetical protein